MSNYDFASLSGYDFALLARDLIQRDMGIRLESFSAGPDAGIDFRHIQKSSTLVVQCKHFAGSTFSSLKSVLKNKERPKIERLSPTRYVLATSIALSPARKDQIVNLLAPYCLSPSDILGKEDLNNLIGLHPRIERKHFKLWLTSEALLRRVLDSGIFADSETQLERIRLRLCRYVRNPSFDRAQTLLRQRHYCIIAGIPGIGKTTLAEVLLADLVDRHGFEPFRISGKLDEIRPVKNAKRKQVFYFDDFLGRTNLDKLERNEDQRILELMEEVESNRNWRFILTTREYILNKATFRSETFAHHHTDFNQYVIKLDDYDRSVRARILYNHIYYSGLPKPYKLALIQDRAYEDILDHRNYSPRVIQYMTEIARARVVKPSLYLKEFTDSLEHPARIWEHAFRHQLSDAGRHLLLVLSTLPDEVLLSDLETAFWSFYKFRQTRFGFATGSGDWDNALKELDGNFVTTKKLGTDLVVSFHNPSIRDFLEDFLSNSERDVLDQLHSVVFYEQYAKLWEGREGNRYPAIRRHPAAFLNPLPGRLFVCPSARAVRHINSHGETVSFEHSIVSNESRARFALGVVSELNSHEAKSFLTNALISLEKLWQTGHADRSELARLISSLTDNGLSKRDEAFLAARHCLLMDSKLVDDYRAVAAFVEKYPDELTPNELERTRNNFRDFAAEYVTGWDDDDADWLRQVAADLEFVANRLRVDVQTWTSDLESQAAAIEAEKKTPASESTKRQTWSPYSTSEDNVDDMFESMKNDLLPSD
jgi:hypothetical protein